MSIVGVLPDSMPGDRVRIFDQSSYNEVIASSLKDPIGFFAFVSPKGIGRDSKLVPITSAEVSKYGVPSYEKWGVSLYNVNNYIKGGGTVLGMRVQPANATLANLAVVAKYKIALSVPATDDTGAPLYTDAQGKTTTVAAGNTPIVRDVLQVKLVTQSFSADNATSEAAIKSALDALKSETEDASSFKTYPLFAIHMKPHGSFGNNIAVRIAFDTTMEGDIAKQRFYNLSATDLDAGSKLSENVTFTFNSDYTYNGATMFAPEVMESLNPYLGIIMSSSFNNFAALLTASGTNPVDGETSFSDIDFLFGLRKNGSKHYKYMLDAASVSLSAPSGIALAGGSDGDFALDNANRKTAISAAMVAAYNGTVTDLIYDEVRYPFIHVFDNDDDQTVKDAAEALSNKRYSTVAILSAPPTLKTYTEMDSLRASTFKYDTCNSIWYTESGLVVDPYSGKRVRMPASYFNSFSYAYHIANKGLGIPFAGKFFNWVGFIPNTLTPQSTNTEVLKKQHINRLNQMFEDGKGAAQPYQQITMQSQMSKLSEINNVHILKYMIRIALETSDANRWNFNEDTDIATFQKTLKDAIDVKLNGLYQKVEITCERESANGAGANRIKAKLNVFFKDVLKGVTYEFYIK